MFGRIAHRYDLLNRTLSLGCDRRWRRAVAARVATAAPGRLLDVCTGTGDIALGQPAVGSVYGCDFCLPMLVLARDKAVASATRPAWFAADALRLPVADGALDAVTVAFGIRNFEDLEAGLHELARVLRPHGRVVILEFSTPRGGLAPVLRWWVRQVPPLRGAVDLRRRRGLPLPVERRWRPFPTVTSCARCSTGPASPACASRR